MITVDLVIQSVLGPAERSVFDGGITVTRYRTQQAAVVRPPAAPRSASPLLGAGSYFSIVNRLRITESTHSIEEVLIPKRIRARKGTHLYSRHAFSLLWKQKWPECASSSVSSARFSMDTATLSRGNEKLFLKERGREKNVCIYRSPVVVEDCGGEHAYKWREVASS